MAQVCIAYLLESCLSSLGAAFALLPRSLNYFLGLI